MTFYELCIRVQAITGLSPMSTVRMVAVNLHLLTGSAALAGTDRRIPQAVADQMIEICRQSVADTLAEYVAGLRMLADLLEAHPELMTPYKGIDVIPHGPEECRESL